MAVAKLAEDDDAESQESEFSFTVMDVFNISGSDWDVVATGQVKSGRIQAGGKACVVSADGSRLEIEIVEITKSRKLVDVAETGNIVGLGVIGASKEQISAGDSIVDSC